MRSLVADGGGDSFFRFSIARLATPLGSPSLAVRSKSTTGTLAFARCAAICAPITPAPSTAVFLTCNVIGMPPAQPCRQSDESAQTPVSHCEVARPCDGVATARSRSLGVQLVSCEPKLAFSQDSGLVPTTSIIL